jgi:5-methylcytosine-specific restriction endonuclease McrA
MVSPLSAITQGAPTDNHLLGSKTHHLRAIRVRVDESRSPWPRQAEKKHRYPKDWKLRIRFVRFYRAKNHCEWCGCENYQPHPVTGSIVVLTVAHVFDDRPEASSLMNLAALCQRCHNRHDAKDRQRRRKERIHAASGQQDFWMNV